MAQAITTAKFIQKAKAIHGNKYTYENVEYVRALLPVDITCPTHGSFIQTPNNHLRGRGCMYCAGWVKFNPNKRYNQKQSKRKDTVKSFIKKATTKHGSKYNYGNVVYENSFTNVEIICPDHGYFMQNPVNHINGEGCPLCSHNISAGELEVKAYVESLGFTTIGNNRKIIAPLELDIVIPDKRLAIEYCGMYWHSADFKPQAYHQDKTISANKAGYRLFTLFEKSWMKDKAKVKRHIKKLLGLAKEIEVTSARPISKATAEGFINAVAFFPRVGESNIGVFCGIDLVGVISDYVYWESDKVSIKVVPLPADTRIDYSLGLQINPRKETLTEPTALGEVYDCGLQQMLQPTKDSALIKILVNKLPTLTETGIKLASGRLCSKRMTQSWMSTNCPSLLTNILTKTAEIEGSPLPERVWAYDNLPIQYCLTCGKPAHKLDGAWSKYCSHECASQSRLRSSNISAGHANANKLLANERRAETMIQKYGFAYNSQRPEVKQMITDTCPFTKVDKSVSDLITDPVWLNHQYNELGKSASEIADEIGCYYDTVLVEVRRNGWVVKQRFRQSKEENQIAEYIESLGVSVVRNDRTILKGKEIDILIPSHNIGIEVDGLYWHSIPCRPEPKALKEKHLQKTLDAAEAGIQLIHLTDYQWNNQQNICQDFIKSKLGLCRRVYARKCSIVEVDSKTASTFLNKNHFQGRCNAHIAYGLMFEGNLVALMTFGKPRFSTKTDWELIRFCGESGITVVGGFSKLLKHFQSNHTGSILSYADRSRSNGYVYERNGFTFCGQTNPGYLWTDGIFIVRRSQSMKHVLPSWLSTFNPDESETDNMFNAGWRRYWDCGNLVYIL